MTEAELRPSKFDVWAVAFDWFRILRERPVAAMAITGWSLLPSLFVILLDQALWWSSDPTFHMVADLLPLPLRAIAQFFLMLAMPVAWLHLATDGTVKPGFPLRLGPVEWRYGLSAWGISGLGALSAIPFAGLGVVIFSVIQAQSGIAVHAVYAVLIALPLLWVFARLSPCLALSVTRSKILVWRSWAATRPVRFSLIWAWLPFGLFVAGMMAGTAWVSQALMVSVPAGGHIAAAAVTGGLRLGALLILAFTTGWAMSIHAAVARYLLRVDPELGLDPVPAP